MANNKPTRVLIHESNNSNEGFKVHKNISMRKLKQNDHVSRSKVPK